MVGAGQIAAFSFITAMDSGALAAIRCAMAKVTASSSALSTPVDHAQAVQALHRQRIGRGTASPGDVERRGVEEGEQAAHVVGAR